MISWNVRRKFPVKRVIKEYKDFFIEANKTMTPESVVRAEEKANQIMLNLKLGELRKELGIKQGDIKGFSQSGVSKIEGREDLKISTLISYCKALGVEVEIKTFLKKALPKSRSKVLLRAG
jgi:hypothetical protein